MNKSWYVRTLRHFKRMTMFFNINSTIIYVIGIIILVSLSKFKYGFLEGQVSSSIVIITIVLIGSIIGDSRIYIAGVWESKKDRIISQKIYISGIKNGLFSWGVNDRNDWLAKIYPDIESVHRADLVCTTDSGEKIRCRIICSQKKRHMLVDICFEKIPIIITYGKYSKIIYKYDCVEPAKDYNLIDKLNKTF